MGRTRSMRTRPCYAHGLHGTVACEPNGIEHHRKALSATDLRAIWRILPRLMPIMLLRGRKADVRKTVEAAEEVGCKASGRLTSAMEVWVFAG